MKNAFDFGGMKGLKERRDRRLLAEYAEASEHVSSTPVGL